MSGGRSLGGRTPSNDPSSPAGGRHRASSTNHHPLSTTLIAAVFIAVFISVNTWITLHQVLLKDSHSRQSLDARAMTIDNSISNTASSSTSGYGYFVPEGKATALPSIRTSSEEEAGIDRRFYGGAGDKKHLGERGLCFCITIEHSSVAKNNNTITYSSSL